jgi:hypothetical protein
MLSGSVRRDVITDADRQQDLKSGFVRLVGETSSVAKVGQGQFAINQVPLDFSTEHAWPLITRDFKFCDDYYGAHAASRITCSIPPGAKSFSVIAYNMGSRTAKFRLITDGKPILDSIATDVAILKVDLPDKSSNLDLFVDPMEDVQYDHAYWCYPRFHSVSAERITDKMLDGKPGPLKFNIVSSEAEYGVTRNQPISILKSAPVHFRDAEPCDEFIFAHAPSTVTYRVPEGMTRFTAIGYNAISHHVKFEVWADAKRVYESPDSGIVNIDVKLPPRTKSIELKTDDLGRDVSDFSMWCYPRLYRK